MSDARRAVNDDSGVGTVRSDIKILSLNTIIEAKCTRTSTNLKKLTDYSAVRIPSIRTMIPAIHCSSSAF